MFDAERLHTTIKEARRFLDKAEQLHALMAMTPKDQIQCTQRYSTIVENAEVKRASMDLTRKLSELRKP